jgi:hypothetical protein
LSVAARAVAAVLSALATLALSPPAAATPEGRTGARVSVCGLGDGGRFWERTRPCFAVTGDLLFGRERNGDFAFGPFVELSTAGFWDARFGGGASLLIPVHGTFPLVASAGVFAHELRAVAVGGNLFFGARSYNFHGAYGLAAGLFAGASVDLGDRRETLVVAGADVDAFFLAAPFLLLHDALR